MSYKQNIPRHITAQWLENRRACPSGIRAFTRVFPNGAHLNGPEDLRTAAREFGYTTFGFFVEVALGMEGWFDWKNKVISRAYVAWCGRKVLGGERPQTRVPGRGPMAVAAHPPPAGTVGQTPQTR